MMNKFNRNGALNTADSGVVLYQKIDSIGGLPLTAELVKDLCIKQYEILTAVELEKIESLTSNPDYGSYVSGLLYGADQDDDFSVIKPILDFIHSKRFVMFDDLKGVRRVIGIPSDRGITENSKGFCSYSRELVQVARAYKKFKEVRTNENEVEEYNKFLYFVNKLNNRIASRILSKRFKDKFQFKFRGLSGVAITGNVSYNGILLPEWYCKKHGIKIGDCGLVTRDPIQNIVLCLRVEGFTRNEMRVNSQTITLVDGDFDGDRIQFIPFQEIVEECARHNVHRDSTEVILREIIQLLPTNIMNNPEFARLVRNYSL
ncbi:MAG: hypothetical protein ACRCX8_20200 [Sarcina sp.]